MENSAVQSRVKAFRGQGETERKRADGRLAGRPDVEGLRPTLWRTARALTGEGRLDLLRLVAEGGGGLNVLQLAQASKRFEPQVSNDLRALNARGILGVERRNACVYYGLVPDRSLPVAASVQNAFRRLFRSGNLPDDWKGVLVPQLRAFSHFRRLAMMDVLLRSPGLAAQEWRKAVGIPPSSFLHHFKTLLRSGLLREDRSGGFSLLRPAHPVVRVLFDALAGSPLP